VEVLGSLAGVGWATNFTVEIVEKERQHGQASVEVVAGLSSMASEGIQGGDRRVRRIMVRFDPTPLFISLNHGRSVSHSLVEQSAGSVYFTTRFSPHFL
jgi:hypothetical protein